MRSEAGPLSRLVDEALARCDRLAQASEESGRLTRTFLSPPMHEVHRLLTGWMQEAGLRVWVDAVGNIHGLYPAAHPAAPRLLIGSHLDTVRNAGRYDGILGVLLGLALVAQLQHRRLPFAIEVIGFSEEEGVRFNIPFIGSRALVGRAAELLEARDASGVTVAEAVRAFGLAPEEVTSCICQKPLGYLEIHIEQGPMLERQELSVGVVQAIVGLSRLRLRVMGRAAHAGTTPMDLRQDALAGAASFVIEVERVARAVPGLRATVGQLTVAPGAANVIPGEVTLSLDLRHRSDMVRQQTLAALLDESRCAAQMRGLAIDWEVLLDQQAVEMDARWSDLLERAMLQAGHPACRLVSGAGHDAMIMAEIGPAAMLFVRSPGGISHHPDESVRHGDVAAALAVGANFFEQLAEEMQAHA